MAQANYYRTSYEALRRLSVGQPRLDIHVHRYLAVAKNARIGCFSTLAMAFQEVDDRQKYRSDSSWGESSNWPRPESYVSDLATGKVYARKEK